MKNALKYLFLAAILTFPSATAFAQMPGTPPVINVAGSAEVKVAPDEIDLKVGVETISANLETAKHDNDERVAKSLAFLKASGVPEKDVQTDYISLNPEYSNGLRTGAVNYVARKSMVIRLTKVDGFENILSGLLTNGVNTVQGIEFRTSQLRKYRDEARSLAIKAAREKADAMAADLGVKRGKVYNINANDYGGWYGGGGNDWGNGMGGSMYQNSVQNEGGASTQDGTLSVGQISVSASVSVSFLIE